MATTRIVNCNARHQALIIEATRDVVEYGDAADVDADVAGSAPIGVRGEDGFEAGSGLLAQPYNWRPAEPGEQPALALAPAAPVADPAPEASTADTDASADAGQED